MIYNKLTLQGFYGYSEETILDFPLGMTGVISECTYNSLKSNGGGKSTLFIAIRYACFNKVPYDTLDEAINSDCSEMRVVFDFTISDVDYRIERGRKKGKAYVNFYKLVNGEEKPYSDESTASGDVQKDIETVLGMDYMMFTASVMLEQNAASKFLDSGSATDYIDKVLQLDQRKDEITSLKKSVNALKKDIKNYQDQLSAQKISLDELLKQNKSNTSLSDIEDNIKTLSQTKNVLNNECEELQKVVSDYNASQSVRENIKSIENSLDIDSEELIKLEQMVEDERKTLSATSPRLEALNKNLVSYQDSVVNLDKDITNLNQDKLRLDLEIKQYEDRKNNIQEGVCDVCESKVDMGHVISKHGEYDLKISACKTKLKSVDEKLVESSEKRFKYLDLISDLKTSVDGLNKKVLGLENDIRLHDRIISDTSNRISMNTEKLEELVNKAKDFSEVSLEDIQKDLLSKREQINKLSDELTSFHAQKGRIEQWEWSVKQSNDNISNLTKKIDDINQEYLDKEILVEVLGDMYTEKFESSVASININTNNILQEILPSVYVDIEEDSSKKNRPLKIQFTYDGCKRSFKGLSGGEQMVVSIALRLGFSQVICDYASTAIQAIVLDEPFGPLDESSREEVKNMLSFLDRYFKQVFIISHTTDIHDFPNLIKVIRDEQSSRKVEVFSQK